MADKTTKPEPKDGSEDAAKAELKEAAQPFKCPNDNCTRFHKAEFGELVSGGVFVTKDVTFRCVLCHTEYTTVRGEVVKA